MTAYYNENDPKAAAWLRELIAERLIAPGEVDDRSVADIQPTELLAFTQCHFFAGIGGWSYALRLAEWPDDRSSLDRKLSLSAVLCGWKMARVR